MAVGVEGDDEAGLAALEHVTQPGEQRTAAVRRRRVDGVELEVESEGLLSGDRNGAVRRVVVDEEDVEPEAASREDRSSLLDLGEHRGDRTS